MFQFLGDNYNATDILTIICSIVALYYLVRQMRSKKKLPPGPIGLPIVGYIPFLTKMPHLKMGKLASKYGDVFSLYLGSTLVVVLNKGRIIREAFSKPEFLGRPPDTVITIIENFQSPFFSNGKAWHEQRRFALQTMRDLGFGKSRMEKHILEEIEHLLQEFRKSNEKPIDISQKLAPSMSNNICSLVFGSRYKYDDPQRIFLDKSLELITRSIQQLQPYIFFPWLRKLPFLDAVFKPKVLEKEGKDLINFMREHIDRHEKTLDPDNVRDYIDGYLLEMKTRKEKDPETTFSHNMLVGSTVNFFAAGSETVRTTITWCLYTMAVFQQVQRKVQSEIDEVIGKERMPSWPDQKEMPFTQAVLAEVQRWKSIVPINLLRYTLQDTELQGYHIPKNTVILANFWSVHHDPEEWERPDDFRPDRFLSEDGKTVTKPLSYMPFSTGKRSCPGEILALIEIFLYFTSILQKFDVEIPEGHPVSFEGHLGITYHLDARMLCFKQRA